jgi:hypothetical protein
MPIQLNLEPKLKKIEQKGEEVAAEDVEKKRLQSKLNIINNPNPAWTKQPTV